ncbi:sensor histidine kinase [Paenimyroides baculatum]|uniref:Histidine kinase n=1 Tax=Paenimyroides baculatum TaxID=2608000 RepID=A0A5M6CKY1_9FLAO|nr:hypothetical protein [Paenimyroides baculatum]KAA5535784.1 hypothetical protein F0460_04925 [Paenimyroides baculatum]
MTFDFYRASSLDNKQAVQLSLNNIESLLKKGNIIGDEYAYNLLDWKADFFLDIKMADSAFFYIEELRKIPDFDQNQRVKLNRYKSRLENIRGNHEKASELLNIALAESLKVQAEQAEEMDNLLYAQTQAEHHKLAFERSEAEKKKRNLWIILISLLLLVVAAVSIILLRLKDRKIKKAVKDLNETANIQITLMEQFESEVRKEEQERLSKNLHDDLAGTLAAIKYNIDLQIMDVVEEGKREELTRLSDMMNSAFKNVQKKAMIFLKRLNYPLKKYFTNI